MPDKNRNKKDNFDKLLTDALKQYRQPAPADFPQKMLSRLEQFEQTQALKKVVWQERALMAAFILFPIAVITAGLMFPNLFLFLLQWPAVLYPIAKQAVAAWSQQWQLWLYYAGAASAAVYAV